MVNETGSLLNNGGGQEKGGLNRGERGGEMGEGFDSRVKTTLILHSTTIRFTAGELTSQPDLRTLRAGYLSAPFCTPYWISLELS